MPDHQALSFDFVLTIKHLKVLAEPDPQSRSMIAGRARETPNPKHLSVDVQFS